MRAELPRRARPPRVAHPVLVSEAMLSFDRLLAVASCTLLSLAACAAPDGDVDLEDTSGAAATGTAADEPVPRSRVPEVHAFVGWRDDTQTVSDPKPKDVERVQIACADKTLYPTHPQSSLKKYHRYSHGRYDHAKLDGESPVCKVKGGGRNSAGKIPCLSPAGLDYAMLSDTYEDSCGNRYRGYWENLYLTTDETMGTLMSRGRTVYTVPNAQFSGEVYDGATYAVDAGDFAFVSALLPGDEERIANAKDLSKTTHRYDPQKHTFEYVGPNK